MPVGPTQWPKSPRAERLRAEPVVTSWLVGEVEYNVKRKHSSAGDINTQNARLVSRFPTTCFCYFTIYLCVGVPKPKTEHGMTPRRPPHERNKL